MCNISIFILFFSFFFQLSELEQRVVEAETRAEDAEGKVRHSDEDERPRFWISKAFLLAYLIDSETDRLEKGIEIAAVLPAIT